MARGFLSGVLWGGIMSVGIAGVASVLAPPPVAPEVGDAAPGTAVAPDRIVDAGSGKQGSDSDRAPVTGQVAPQTLAPDPDSIAGIDADMTAPAAIPETGDAANLDAPDVKGDVNADASGAMPLGDDPVLPNPQALAPMEPEAADEVSISTEPAQPPAPEPESVQGAFDAPAQPETGAAEEAEIALPRTDENLGDEDLGDENADEVDETLDDQRVATAVAPELDTAPDEDVSEPVITPVAPPSIILNETPQETPAPDAVLEDAVPEGAVPEDGGAGNSETASARPEIGTPSVALTERSNGVTVNRLTNTESAQVAVQTEATADETSAETEGSAAKPIKAFAQEFENPDNKPMMSVVLIDDGSTPAAGGAGIAALRSFPYPLSFAVDSALPDAADRMALYRAEGFEVLAMVNLPEGAAPVDAETTFGVTLEKLPEVVGILEGTTGGLQGSRDVADQVTAILAQSGHGLVTQDRGLNTMPKLARKGGVPADPVFRDFDSNDQTAQVIRRFLDQAAFRAGQEGSVIMLGRLRADTISALLLWGLQDRAGQVALAPISAVLTRE